MVAGVATVAGITTKPLLTGNANCCLNTRADWLPPPQGEARSGTGTARVARKGRGGGNVSASGTDATSSTNQRPKHRQTAPSPHGDGWGGATRGNLVACTETPFTYI